MAKVKNNKSNSTPKKHRSALLQVIKNKNSIERRAREKKNIKIKEMRSETVYSAKLMREMEIIDDLLNKPNIDAVIIEVEDKDFNLFSKAINRNELASYDIVQSQTNAKEFIISRQDVYF